MLANFLVSLSALAIAGGPPPMAPFNPVQDFAPKSVNLDDPLGKGFGWDRQLPCGANRATVTVKFDRAYFGKHGSDAPVAKVWLHAGKSGDASEQWAAAVLQAPTDTWKLNALTWLEKVTPSKSEGPGYAPADFSRPTRIDFAWNADGLVSVDFGGEFLKQVSLDKPITGIGLGGSWSKFEFINLEVGRAGPADPACNRVAIQSSGHSPPSSDR